MKTTCFIGSDHGGYAVKEYIKTLLKKKNITFADLGPYNTDSVDYPDFAEKVARSVQKTNNAFGILACSTGIGISIAANKVHGIRAALVKDANVSRLSREHNNANILVVQGKPYTKKNISAIVDAWISSSFEGGRHSRRVNKITAIEKKHLR